MLKSKRNFAYAGNTYFVGDTIPDNIAAKIDPSFVEKPKPTKIESTPTNISEGE